MKEGYVRVSQIVQRMKGPSVISDRHRAAMENKARIGTNVHQAIEDYLKGAFPILEIDEEGYFESYLKWHKQNDPVYVSLDEKRMYCDEYRLTGEIDGLLVHHIQCMTHTECIIIDYKCTNEQDKIGWPIQFHMYAYLLTKRFLFGNLQSRKGDFIKLDKNGNLPKTFSYTYDKAVLEKCLEEIKKYWKEVDNNCTVQVTYK